MALGYEFAPIDVTIIVHDKVLAIDEKMRHAAFGLWCWGQCYAKLHKSAGLLKRSAVLTSMAGPIGLTLKLAAELVRVGLWHLVEDGWQIHNFEKKSAGMSSSAERMRRLRDRRRGDRSDVTGDVTASHVTTSSDGECSTSPSYSSGSSSSGEGPGEGPPPWFDGVVATIGMTTGVELAAGEVWLRYRGHRHSVGKPMNRPDAEYWLTSVVVPEVREAKRRAARDRDRDNRYADHAPKHEKPTAGQASAFQAELARRLAEEAKKGAA